jgi:phosphinothricin acetyltransferase
MTATLRLATRDDAPPIARIYGPFCESTAVSFESAAPTVDEMAARIAAITAQYPWLVLENAGTIAGYAYASRHRERAAYAWSVDTAVYVEDGHRRRGVGRALYSALFAALRLQGYFKAFAGIALPNAPSVALHEAAGFGPVGTYRGAGYKHGKWHDVAWFQAMLQPERDDPTPPVAVSTIVDTPRWHHALAQAGQLFS